MNEDLLKKFLALSEKKSDKVTLSWPSSVLEYIAGVLQVRQIKNMVWIASEDGGGISARITEMDGSTADDWVSIIEIKELFSGPDYQKPDEDILYYQWKCRTDYNVQVTPDWYKEGTIPGEEVSDDWVQCKEGKKFQDI